MKYLIAILFVISSFYAKAQFPSQAIPTQYSTGWFRWAWPQSDSGLILASRVPNFTPKFGGTIFMYPQAGADTSVVYWNGNRYIKLTPGFDSTSLSNRINLKLNILDTTNKWWSINKRWVDSVYRVNDSTIGFTINNGAQQTFQILGRSSGGGGAAGTVTSVALSMSSAFTVTGSPITTNGTFNVTGAGTSAQYIRGNGTLATTDTGMIPNFYLKVRSLLSGTSPIVYNSITGAISIPNANNTGTKGAATFNNSDFTDNGAGLISLRNPAGTPGVDTIFRVPGVDSIYYTINGVQRAVKDSLGTGGGGGTVTQVNTGFGLSGGPITGVGTAEIDTSATDQRYEKIYNITDVRFAGGAVADGKENSTASMTSGSATLTCTTCGFTSGDIGKWIRVYRAAASSMDMVTTITGFTNATTVTLNTTAGSTVSADTVIYGTDNVPAIQAALDYANEQGGSARVIIPPPGFGRFYVLGGALNHSGSDCNCQINFPIADIGDTTFNNRKNIILDGVVGPNYTPSALFSDTATPKMNTTLVSIIHGSGIRPSVFAAKANSFLYANYINYNLITVKNIALLVERNRAGGGPDIGGFNFYNASSSPMENVVVSWNGPIHGTTQPTNEVAGVIAGQLSSEIYTTLKNVSVFGFKYGIVITESVSMDHVIAHACVNGLTLIHGNYPVVGGYVDAHWCKNSVYVPASTILGDINPGLVYFNFQNLALEVFQGSGLGAPAWLDYVHVISDSSSYGRGNIYGYTLGHAEVGIDNSMFNKFGADSIFCYQTGSAVDRNPHIYAGLTEYAGWQNNGLTNYWYNWSPLNDASIMRLSPITDGSQALYISPTGTGGVGLPQAWINLFNTPLWTGLNTTSSNTELLQFSANGTSGYGILSTQSGAGTVRDINIGTGSITSQLKIGASGTTSLNSTSIDDALLINGSSTNRVSIVINNANAAGSGSLYVQNNRGSFNAYGGMLTGGASDAASSIFGLTRPDRTFIIHDGANGAGMGIGTLISQPLVLGTNNVARISVAGTGAITFNSAFTFPTTDGSANQVLRTNGSGVVTWQTVSGSGITTLNTLTAATQTFATGTSGSDLNISSTSSTHTFNLPDAGTSTRGVVSVGGQTFHGQKTFESGVIIPYLTSGALVMSSNVSASVAPGISGIGLALQTYTYTDNGSARTESTAQNLNLIGAPVITSSNAIIYSDNSSTIRITGAPIASGSMTLSHPWAIYANDVNYVQTLAMGLNEQSSSTTLGNGSMVVYTGTGGHTFTLPGLATHPGKVYFIKNAGSGSVTIARGGSDNIYDTSSVTSITVSAGSAVIIGAGSSFWYVQ